MYNNDTSNRVHITEFSTLTSMFRTNMSLMEALGNDAPHPLSPHSCDPQQKACDLQDQCIGNPASCHYMDMNARETRLSNDCDEEKCLCTGNSAAIGQ